MITRAFWACALAVALALPAPAAGQQERIQVAWSGVWPGEVHVLFGADGALDVGGGDCVPGGPPCEVPSWTVLMGAYGGVVTEPVPISIAAHVGLERKLTADLSLGVVGFGFAHPLQGGAALRFDALDVGALRLGYGWGDEEGVLVATEVATAFIVDVLFR